MNESNYVAAFEELQEIVGEMETGNINIDELQKVAVELKDSLAGLMVTYPSTHGVFEEGIIEITSCKSSSYVSV